LLRILFKILFYNLQMARFYYALYIFLMISCVGREDKVQEASVKRPTVAVVNYPLYYFAKTIGGDFISVYLPAIEGDPAYWKPDTKQVINFQNAALILDNGAGYAKWMEKVSLPSSKIVNTSMSFKDQWIETDEGITHSHGPEGEHVHQGTAFTTWLNFKFALKQAASVHQALKNILPEHTDQINQNYNQLKNSLGDYDKRMEAIASALNGQLLIASHSVYQYLEQGYGLNLLSEHWEPDNMPTKEQWEAVEKVIRDHKVNIMIWEDAPIQEIESKLVDLEITIVVFRPCANRPETGDFMNIMNENLLHAERVINSF